LPSDAGRATLAALDLLLADAPDLARRLPAGWSDAMRRYVDLLLDANRHINLTRVTEPGAIARDHLLDALAALPLLEAPGTQRVIDLGSGGGVPAIPLAVARPDLEWTLVDSVGKKADALRGFVVRLGLTNVAVLSQRLETLGRDTAHRAAHDLATARACAALPVLAELALPLLRTGGELIAWKGPLTADDAELRAGRGAAALLGGAPPEAAPTGVAALGGRTLVRVAKPGRTDDRYPRRPGVPARRPLA
jgi:16S rRNA (guanine527-N7)-methyltransferase